MSEAATLVDLVKIVLDPSASDEAKRLSVSVAYHKGVNDGLACAKEKADEIRPRIVRFT